MELSPSLVMPPSPVQVTWSSEIFGPVRTLSCVQSCPVGAVLSGLLSAVLSGYPAIYIAGSKSQAPGLDITALRESCLFANPTQVRLMSLVGSVDVERNVM